MVKKLGEATGVSVRLNTSFNSPMSAIRSDPFLKQCDLKAGFGDYAPSLSVPRNPVGRNSR